MSGVRGEMPGWSLVWADEFDGPAGAPPGPERWRPEVGGHGWGNEELQEYTDSTDNASLDGAGNLAVAVRATDRAGADPGGHGYTSARVITKDRATFSRGLVQARIRLPGGRGLWPAFWMLGTDIDEVGWPQCGEIDVMEGSGDHPRRVAGAVHGPGYSGGGGITAAREAREPLADAFHVYSVRWEPDRIRWYLDGVQYGTVTRGEVRHPWVFDHEFYLLLNVAVGGTFGQGPDSSLTLPRAMLVDYVRVHAPAASG